MGLMQDHNPVDSRSSIFWDEVELEMGGIEFTNPDSRIAVFGSRVVEQKQEYPSHIQKSLLS